MRFINAFHIITIYLESVGDVISVNILDIFLKVLLNFFRSLDILLIFFIPLGTTLHLYFPFFPVAVTVSSELIFCNFPSIQTYFGSSDVSSSIIHMNIFEFFTPSVFVIFLFFFAMGCSFMMSLNDFGKALGSRLFCLYSSSTILITLSSLFSSFTAHFTLDLSYDLENCSISR